MPGLDYIKFGGDIYINGTGDHFFTVSDGTNVTPSTSISNINKDIVLIEGTVKISASPLLGYTTTIKFSSNSGTQTQSIVKSGDPKTNGLSLEFKAWNSSTGTNTMDIRDFFIKPALFG